MNQRLEIDIIGGGISGLSIAYFLTQNSNYKLNIYEQSNRLGGLIETRKTSYGIAELGAASWLNSTFMEDFINELKLPIVDFNIHNKNKFIFRNKMTKWPLNLAESANFIYHLFIKNHLSRTKLRPRPTESIAQWGDRAIGPAASFNILQTALQGVYVGDAQQLNASMILDHHFQNEKKSKPLRRGSIAPKKGMEQLIATIEQQLIAKGATIYLNTKYKSNEQNQKRIKIFAIPLPALLAYLPLAEQEELKKISYESVTTVTTFHTKQSSLPHGFGCLFTPNSRSNSLGAIFSDGLFHQDKEYQAMRWIFHGEKVCDKSHMQSMIQEDYKRMTGDNLDIIDLNCQVVPQALPYYNHQLRYCYESILRPYAMGKRDTYIHGNYMKGIGLSQIIEKASTLAQEIIKHHE